MTEIEIDKALALAIGWKESDMTLNTGVVRCYYPKQMAYDSSWRVFDHRDWNVIGPIAERYDCFPKYNASKGWMSWVPACEFSCADTPQKAIALAVIGALT